MMVMGGKGEGEGEGGQGGGGGGSITSETLFHIRNMRKILPFSDLSVYTYTTNAAVSSISILEL